jgi:23S rRNA (adenine2503-C2)-methyltransferase
MFLQEIQEAIAVCALKPYRAEQIARWLYQQGVHDFNRMSNLSKPVRTLLAEQFSLTALAVRATQQSLDGKTSKFLLEFDDGSAVETVLMRQPYGNSVCVSTQVGCAMGCVFCASTLKGVVRDLTAGEILAQVMHVQNILQCEEQRVNTIVIMGSGEPLANYENVLRFIRLCHESYGLNLSYRNITLSTSGLVPGIDRLAAEGLPLTLSISLHAPNDAIRSQLMPVNQLYSIAEVLAAGDRYGEKTGRRVTYEYTLIAGKNDKPEHACEVAALLKGRLANVNLIPVNPVPERGVLRPGADSIRQFESMLLAKHINVTVRKEMGTDIRAACGQLRHQVLSAREERNAD